jgi:hypothetical protein
LIKLLHKNTTVFKITLTHKKILGLTSQILFKLNTHNYLFLLTLEPIPINTYFLQNSKLIWGLIITIIIINPQINNISFKHIKTLN